jgi:L-alanine-DL-glutamate epimerase-like enolase superfamily enzyme
VKELEPLNLLFVEKPCPPENVKAMARIARRSTTPIATGERLVASFGVRELIEMGVVDILQTDIHHVGGISALWKVAVMADAGGITMAPHACEGPIGGIATLHVDAASRISWCRRFAAVSPAAQKWCHAVARAFRAVSAREAVDPIFPKLGLNTI